MPNDHTAAMIPPSRDPALIRSLEQRARDGAMAGEAERRDEFALWHAKTHPNAERAWTDFFSAIFNNLGR